MSDLWSDLLGCLDLSAAADVLSADVLSVGVDEADYVFEARNQQLEYHRVFGGQLLAQFARAAASACPDKAIKSLHALFAREGKTAEPMRYLVRCHHEGRSFATLTITAEQSVGVIATAAVSMHVAEDGPDQQAPLPSPVLLSKQHEMTVDLLPWEIRATVDLDDPSSAPAEFEFWMRTPPTDPQLAPALTAYATDLTLIGTALRPLDGLSQRGNGVAFASAVTSHTLWFHRPMRTDEWLLLRQHSPLLAHGRCFGRGDVLTEDGILLASYAQEAMLRLRP